MKYLDDNEVKELLSGHFSSVIDCVESAFVDSTADMVPKIYLNSGNNQQGDYRAMPAALGGYAALKWIGVFPNNPKGENPMNRKLPTTIGTLILNDRFTGFPLMAMDCTVLTAYRTAATSAIAAKYCAPDRVEEIALIGCGDQAYHHALAYKEIFQDFKISLHDRNMEAAVNLSLKLKKHGLSESKFSYNVKDAVSNADIITTLTPSTKPYLNILDLKSNCHVNAVGADAVGKRELMCNVIDGAADIIADDPEQAFHSGELQYNEWPYLNVLNFSNFLRDHKSMQLNKGVSVFDSTGVSIEDIAVGILVHNLYHDNEVERFH
tara:strand:+ start:1260 stop:2225 length:966 start_codon:yes stop_codon:yes gene_type:complete